ncbi:MAG: YceI family protein [Congregibacter sp.]
MSFLRTGFVRAALLLLGVVASVGALADWELDGSRSTVQFMSVKNGSVTELHYFQSISGSITAGKADIILDLDSVETLVPIRNQRLREMLFETAQFPAARLTADVPEAVNALVPGQSMLVQTNVMVSLHGATLAYAAKLQVTRLLGEDLMVVLSEPLVVKAADFGLDAGLTALREVAGLKSINPNVPISGQLMFSASTK